jgi:holliday junction DNA helicase RuvA
MEPRELAVAIERGDLPRLTRIPGVGKKTAERIVVELRDRLPNALAVLADQGPAPAPGDARRDDLASALGNLGYDHRAVDKAVSTVLADLPDASFEQQLRAALKALSRG